MMEYSLAKSPVLCRIKAEPIKLWAIIRGSASPILDYCVGAEPILRLFPYPTIL
jgi:hypothetical protein